MAQPTDQQSHGNRNFHLRILPCSVPGYMSVKWNSTGHASSVSGFVAEILDLMSSRFHFSHAYVPLGRDLPVDDAPNERGLVSYILRGDGDLIACGIVRSSNRLDNIDFTMPVAEGKYGALIPFPSKSINGNALTQPFQLDVWISLIVCFLAVVLTWITFSAVRNRLSTFKKSMRSNDSGSRSVFTAATYATAVILNQGGYFTSRAFAIRLLAGVWCLAAFVLTPAYSGNLTSFLMSPIVKPVIDSIDDIPSVPGLKVATDRGKGFDSHVQSWAKDGTSDPRTVLANQLLKTMFRCNKSETCIDKVLREEHVYIHGIAVHYQTIAKDLKHYKTCRFTVASTRDILENMHLYWGIGKQSPFLNIINKGILDMEAHGLLPYWRDHYLTKLPVQCSLLLGSNHRPAVKNRTKIKQLNLADFSSTFYLLGIGTLVGLFAFFCECLRAAVRAVGLYMPCEF